MQVKDEEALVEDLAAQCKPHDHCLIGVEHEAFIFSRQTQAPLPYDGERSIHALLSSLQRQGWEGDYQREALVGLKRDKAAITLEPAGQLELSGSPWPDLHGVYDEMRAHRQRLAKLSADMDLGVMALGFAPQWSRDAGEWMPHDRYHIMRRYMPRVGVHGLDMMRRCCAFQLNFDYQSEADMAAKVRVATALQPLVMLALANSPFADGRDSGFSSYRNYVWLHTDSARCGVLPLALSPELSFARYVRRAVEVPMYSVKRDDAHVDLAGRFFADMLNGRLPELAGERPTLSDWRAHLNTLMFDVRLKERIELRGNDTLPLEQSMALAAFWTGILYDESSLDAALAFIEGGEAAVFNELRHRLPSMTMSESSAVPVRGMYRAHSLGEALEYTLTLARAGLERRRKGNAHHTDETIYLKPLEHLVEERQSPAEQWQAQCQRFGRLDLSPLLNAAGF
ncbi:glutamate--cysteine ligase [Halomonas alkaliantarctica]|nr:glutamate--cysteine ligase [Halomonas alkaliantarctica]